MPGLPLGIADPKELIKEQQVEALSEGEQRHLQDLERKWKVYREGPEKSLDVVEGKVDDNIPIPYEKVVVDKMVGFLFGREEVEFEIEEAQPEVKPAPKPTAEVERKGATVEKESNATQDHLDAVWKANRKMTLLKKVGVNGGVFGHAFVKIVPRILDGKQIPRLVNLDPMTVRAYWDPADMEETVAYRIRWRNWVTTPGGHKREKHYQQVILRENGQEFAEYDLESVQEVEYTWRIVDMESEPDTNIWKITSDIQWQYAWPPIVDCQHYPLPNEYWGLSEIELGVIAMNQSISRMLSNINRVIKFWGHPRMWMKGVAGQLVQDMINKGDLDMRPDSVLVLPGDTAEVGSMEMQGDMTAALDLYVRIKELYHEVTRMPEVATGKMDSAGNLSGVALEILYGPILEATEDKRRTYGEMLEQLNERILELSGFEALETKVTWPNVMPHDPAAEANVAISKKTVGVSSDTLMTELGYDPDEEKEKRNAEAEENMQRQEQLMSRGIVAPSNPEKKAKKENDQNVPPEEQPQNRGGFPPR